MTSRVAQMPMWTMRRAADAWDWQKRAECAKHDPEIFFPRAPGKEAAREAKRICIMCPVRDECLQHALKYDERLGVWGGMSETEREILVAKLAGRTYRGCHNGTTKGKCRD